MQEVFTGDFVARFTPQELHLVEISSPNLPVPPDGRIRLPRTEEVAPAETVFGYPFLESHVGDPVVLTTTSEPHMSFPIALDVSRSPFDRMISNDKNNDIIRASRYAIDLIRCPNDEEPNGPVEVTFDLKATYSFPPCARDYKLPNQSRLDMGYPSRTLAHVYEAGPELYLAILSVIPFNSSLRSSNPSSGSGLVSTPRSDQRKAPVPRTSGQHSSLTLIFEGHCTHDCMVCSSSGRLVYSQREEGDQLPRHWVVDYLS